MKILLAPHGTRGDVQPMLALALALRARGHTASFLAPNDFVGWIHAHQFQCEPNGIHVERTLRSAGADLASFAWQRHYFNEVLIPALFESFASIEPDVDVIVGAGVQLAAASVAENWRVAHAHVIFCPCVVPNSASPPPTMTTQGLPAFLNRFLWEWIATPSGLMIRGSVNAGRRKLGLAPILNPLSHLFRQPTLLAADHELAPLDDDAPLSITATDAWVLDQSNDMNPRVDRFLALNPSPIYVGFGSMVAKQATAIADDILAAVRAVGRGALIASGWAELGHQFDDVEDVLVVPEIAHDIVLPRVAAAVHHGGAGTTHAAARAGVPQVVLPHVLDQFYWAARVERLGLGPRPLPLGLVTADVLTERLDRALNDPGIGGRAKAFAPVIASRNGVEAAIEFLEELGNR
jgi:vancomycin aglycone glucosyltransferase